ncbi:MAG: MBL fold metallo-hydrolase, partial [Acidobacteriota bacterium]
MKIGDYRLEIIPDTEFRLDGGAMFGVVPRVLWERVSPPDELNRIRLNMNCVFIETPEEKILIETGIGEKWTEKETRMYGIFRERPLADTLLEKTGYTADDITIVVNTHLHFDHAGGNTVLECGTRNAERGMEEPLSTSKIPHSALRIPQFKNARYFVSKSELEHAQNPHERDRASY